MEGLQELDRRVVVGFALDSLVPVRAWASTSEETWTFGAVVVVAAAVVAVAVHIAMEQMPAQEQKTEAARTNSTTNRP